MNNSTSEIPLKRCSKGDNCVHPDGPLLPATTEYFYKKLDGLAAHCKVCRNTADRERAKDPEFRKRKQQHQQRTWAKHGQKYRQHHNELYKERGHIWKANQRSKPDHYIKMRESKRRKYATDNAYRERFLEQKRARRDNPETRDHVLRLEHLSHERNREREKARRRERYANDPEYRAKAQAVSKKYISERGHIYRANRLKKIDHIRDAKREYRKLPHAKELERLYSNRRRARKRALADTFTIQDWQRCLDYFGGVCAICGRPHGLWHTLAQDHWIAVDDPRTDNPGTVATNIIPLCHGIDGCNNRKHNKDALEWLKQLYGKRRAQEILKRINAYFEWVKQQS